MTVGVVVSAVAKRATATLTSRAAGSVEVQVRRPSASGAPGAAWSPVMSTVRSPGTETLSVVSAAGVVVVSPETATNGSRAQPTPGSQASSGVPLAHQVTSSAAPTRSKPPAPMVSVKSRATSVVSPAASCSASRTT